MKVSFAITTHNEGECISKLLSQLQEHIEDQATGDEIVILDDFSEDPDTVYRLENYSSLPYVHFHRRALKRNFGAQKNHLNSLCSGDYIFQIDADEYLAPGLLENLHEILAGNDRVDLFYVPRVNTVEGLTQEHIDQWGWNVNQHGWVMWPDYQTRLYRMTRKFCGPERSMKGSQGLTRLHIYRKWKNTLLFIRSKLHVRKNRTVCMTKLLRRVE